VKKDILSISVEPIDPKLYRGQELTACEVAYLGIEDGTEPLLRWFCTNVLGLPPAWVPYVAMAMWRPDSKGELAWRSAEHPFAFLATVTRRAVIRWNPELFFGVDADKVLRPRERAVSTLRLGIPEDSDWREDPLAYLSHRHYGELRDEGTGEGSGMRPMSARG